LSNIGVDEIVRIAGPLLNITYPIIIVLVVLNLVDKGSLGNSVYIGAVGGTFLFTSLYYICPMFDSLLHLKEMLIKFPLDKYEMGWVLPALGGILIFKVTDRIRQYFLRSETVNDMR
jgi:LIVCS family branched-chain amino acid:cation transporter